MRNIMLWSFFTKYNFLYFSFQFCAENFTFLHLWSLLPLNLEYLFTSLLPPISLPTLMWSTLNLWHLLRVKRERKMKEEPMSNQRRMKRSCLNVKMWFESETRCFGITLGVAILAILSANCPFGAIREPVSFLQTTLLILHRTRW